ncbi:MAG: hypoxanthine-guanine phosphoribosyltransferase [Pseudomonadales bacterium]|nr:hypoxanthine-guanine phosphoribosyltransferase [Pseudomonadales bacterium]MDP6471351.1 hypoxanthine-guanine phosphoribosyltransferase [Pseudomonadales bacterium]MDP6826458.1 hypoxanthine-guanine phosphoribosyltransferase [Pseudomonadales bacterium]MDP6970087.1 hypoxanthine-guanine phosphoribosyltransferase [Pseudomonadales bacterium]
MNSQRATRALARARVLVSAQEVEAAVDRVSVRVSAMLRHSNPVVLCILQGGYAYHAQLCQRLRFPLETGYLHVSRYGENTTGGALHWRARPSLDVGDRTVLVVDDVLDKGVTLAVVIDALKEAGARKVFSTVLVSKDVADRERPGIDFVALHCPDEYLFGCGMDFRGYWRNLPEIYALPADLEHP